MDVPLSRPKGVIGTIVEALTTAVEVVGGFITGGPLGAARGAAGGIAKDLVSEENQNSEEDKYKEK
jgi:hypothetical protein